MRLKSFAVMAAIPFMAACMQGAPIQGPPITVSTKANAGINSRVVGFTEPIIRTYRTKEIENSKITATASTEVGGEQIEKSNRTEISGVNCKLDSKEFFADFVTPTTLSIPVLKGKPSPIRLTCANSEFTSTYHIYPRPAQTTVVAPSLAGVLVSAIASVAVASADRWYFGYDLAPIWVPLETRSGQ